MAQKDVVIKIERAESIHAIERRLLHSAVLEAVWEKIRIDETGADESRIAEERATGLDPLESDAHKGTRIEDDVVQDEAFEVDSCEAGVDINHVFYGRHVEPHIRVGGVRQRRGPHFKILALFIQIALSKIGRSSFAGLSLP